MNKNYNFLRFLSRILVIPFLLSMHIVNASQFTEQESSKLSIKNVLEIVVPVSVGVVVLGTLSDVFLKNNESNSMVDSSLNSFNSREQLWIRLLMGEKITPAEQNKYRFKYSSSVEFREDSNTNLENYHDFIQVFFPNLNPSKYANPDLFINNKLESWKSFLKNNPNSFKKIQDNMRKNLERMLDFWGLCNPDNSGNDFRNHNNQRVSRVLIALKLFGLDKEYNNFFGILNQRYKEHPSMRHWKKTNEIEPLF